MAFFCWFCWAHTLVWSIGVCSVRRFFSPRLLLFLLSCCALCAKTIMHFGIFETIKRLHIASANKFAYRKFKCIIRCGVCAYDDDGGAAAALQEPNLHRYCLFFMRRPIPNAMLPHSQRPDNAHAVVSHLLLVGFNLKILCLR